MTINGKVPWHLYEMGPRTLNEQMRLESQREANIQSYHMQGRAMDYVNEDGEIIHVKLPDPAPERDVFAWPGVGEPELKWCETICHEAAYANEFVGYQMSRANYKSILMAETNLAEERIERALTVLYMQKRI